MARFTKSGGQFQITQSGTLIWSSAWFCCPTVPDLALSGTVSIDFGDPVRDNAYLYSRLANVSVPGGGWQAQEYAYAYLTLPAQETTYSDITLGVAPAACDFLRIKARISRTINPVNDANTMMDLTPIPPLSEWFMVHGGFLPLEQHHPLFRGAYIFNDAGTVKLRRIQSIGKNMLIDDCVSNWVPNNDKSTFLYSANGYNCYYDGYTWQTSKGQPVYYKGAAQSGHETAVTQTDYARGGSHQIDLTDTISLQSIYSLDYNIEPGYFVTDPVIKAPLGKTAIRASYYWRNTPVDSSGNAPKTDTISAVAIGVPDATRQVLVMIAGGYSTDWLAGYYKPPNSVTIGGVAATKLADAFGSTMIISASIWMASVPAGDTADIVINWGATYGVQHCSTLTYVLYHLNSPTPDDKVELFQYNGTSNSTDTLSTVNGGFAFAMAVHLDDAGQDAAGSAYPLLGGFAAGNGFHAMNFIDNPAYTAIGLIPCVYEAAANPTTGADISVVMAAQTNRGLSAAAVSLH